MIEFVWNSSVVHWLVFKIKPAPSHYIRVYDSEKSLMVVDNHVVYEENLSPLKIKSKNSIYNIFT